MRVTSVIALLASVAVPALALPQLSERQVEYGNSIFSKPRPDPCAGAHTLQDFKNCMPKFAIARRAACRACVV